MACRYSGAERRAREDKLYKRLNEPVLRLTDAVRKLHMRIRGAQQSHRHVDHNLQRQVRQLRLLAQFASSQERWSVMRVNEQSVHSS